MLSFCSFYFRVCFWAVGLLPAWCPGVAGRPCGAEAGTCVSCNAEHKLLPENHHLISKITLEKGTIVRIGIEHLGTLILGAVVTVCMTIIFPTFT